jgi:cell wall-associated NlpC family hydrolase
MYPKNITRCLAAALLLAGACRCTDSTPYPDLNAICESVRLRHVPDKRDNVYEIRVVKRDGQPVVKGVTSVAAAKADVLARIRKVYPAAADSIAVLPDTTVGDNVYGVINVSVADARMAADYAAEMGTQLLLGTPVQALQHADWWRIKSPEGYVAWTTQSSLALMDKAAFNRWTAARKIIFTDFYGFAYETPDTQGQHASDLVFGNLLQWQGEQGKFYKAAYPDGRIAYVLKSQSKDFADWQASLTLTEESILQKALTLKGLPYTWGGTSVKGTDCSGFTKTILLMHGIILRRDASQQVKTGIPVDLSEGYGNLRPGDLMFFGRKSKSGKERIRHVAIYKGNQEFIHCAGYVRINSLDPAQPHYDAYNTAEFLRACRIIGAVDTEGIWSIGNNPLYKVQE